MKFKNAIAAFIYVALLPFLAQAQDTDSAVTTVRGELVYGDASAPVEIIEYGSMTCPHCGHFSRDVLPQLKKEYIDTGKVRLIFRNFVRDRYDMAVSTLSRCMVDRDGAKELTESYFTRQEEWMKAGNPYEVIAAIAKDGGVTEEAMRQCISDRSLQEHLVEMRTEGINLYKISAIPYVLLNGVHVEGHSFEALKEAIDAAL